MRTTAPRIVIGAITAVLVGLRLLSRQESRATQEVMAFGREHRDHEGLKLVQAGPLAGYWCGSCRQGRAVDGRTGRVGRIAIGGRLEEVMGILGRPLTDEERRLVVEAGADVDKVEQIIAGVQAAQRRAEEES
jgi:hypothetical protein